MDSLLIMLGSIGKVFPGVVDFLRREALEGNGCLKCVIYLIKLFPVFGPFIQPGLQLFKFLFRRLLLKKFDNEVFDFTW
jgi:hypothetical protein